MEALEKWIAKIPIKKDLDHILMHKVATAAF
jgi:hypothetical protein